jgi:uncharacterized membrane protein
MAYCDKCGVQIAEQAPFCSQCGAQQKAAAARSQTSPGGAGQASRFTENVAATLSYTFLWVGGLVFLLIDKRPFVRFHAAQSVVIFLGLHIVHGILGMFWGLRFLHGGWNSVAPGFVLIHMVDLLTFVLWVVLMIKAYQGEWFKIPIAWEVAEGFGSKVPADKR